MSKRMHTSTKLQVSWNYFSTLGGSHKDCGCYWVIFVFFNFYRLNFHNKLVLLWQIYDEASLKIKTSHDLETMIGSAYSLIPWLDTSVLLLVFVIECEVVNIVWRIVQPLSNMCLYVACSEFSPNYTPIKYRSMSDQVFLFFLIKHKYL